MADLTCAKASRGWRCMREFGHPGSCAAEPTRWLGLWWRVRYWFMGPG